jgi:hypothetical protein
MLAELLDHGPGALAVELDREGLVLVRRDARRRRVAVLPLTRAELLALPQLAQAAACALALAPPDGAHHGVLEVTR